MKQDLSSLPRKAFCEICWQCGGQIVRMPVENKPQMLQWRCDQCLLAYGPVWRKAIWGTKPSKWWAGPAPWTLKGWPKILRTARALVSIILCYIAAIAGMLL
jgi:hypothetical protein